MCWIQKKGCKLYTALSLFLPYFFGLGLLVHSLSPISLINKTKNNQEAARFIALNLLIGISLNHLIMLVVHNMNISLLLGGTLSALGFFSATLVARKSFTSYFKLGLTIWIITILTGISFCIFIVNSRIEWDAQYIWFFHGKMIYYNNGLVQSGGWNNPEYQFSHVDYPKLIAILAAQFAYFIGEWDDYLPRLSLLTLLIPAVLGVSSFFKKFNVSFIYLYLMVFFSLNVYTTNGYMDAYLAIYACISLLFLWRGSTLNDSEDVLTGIAFVSIIPLMKNEGMLFVVSIFFSCSLFFVIYNTEIFKFKEVLKSKVLWCVTFLFISNITVWSLIKFKWGLKNDLNLGSDSIGIISNRLGDGSIFVIIKQIVTYTNIGVSSFLLLLTVICSVKYDVFNFKIIMLCITTAALYFSGLFIIYMATPYDLLWHVSSSAYRTMMAVNLSIIAATYITLTTVEK